MIIKVPKIGYFGLFQVHLVSLSEVFASKGVEKWYEVLKH
jgi:hypothetical protein